MPDFDIVIRNGAIYDGSGGPGIEGDLAIRDGRIAAIGAVSGGGSEEIDAKGKIVTPGFVDIHTHYDGQVTWENRLAPSSNHGVTSVVMGNCGVGFAPCRPEQRDMLVALMEGVEDIPEIVMTEGLPWNWETFADYLEVLQSRRLDVDIATQLPHSAVRVYVMGERGARQEPATEEDLRRMQRLTCEAIRAGALGVSTSRNIMHRTKAGDLAPSLHSDEAEFLALARGLRDAGAGVYQLIPDIIGDIADEFTLMRRIVAESGQPLSFSLIQLPMGAPDAWRRALRMLEEAARDGVPITAQVAPRPVGMLFGLDLSFHPFSLHPSFQPIADLPLADKVKAMRDPALRARLLAEEPQSTNPVAVKTAKGARFAYELGNPPCYEPDPATRLDKRAQAAGLSLEEFVYDILLKQDGRAILYQPSANYRDGNLDAAGEMLRHPNTVMALGDGGAHYGMICDASFPTYLLQRWVRDAGAESRMELGQAIARLTSKPARVVNLHDRGRLAPGYKADVNVIDLDRLHLHAPTVVRNLPAGGRRLQQLASGYAATIVSGVITYRDGVATNALPGRLVRGAQGVPAGAIS